VKAFGKFIYFDSKKIRWHEASGSGDEYIEEEVVASLIK